MALDVFHQILTKLHDLAGGSPRQMVSIVDVLKQERLFGSADMITKKLQAEGWIADAPKTDNVFVTTWGIEEVHRTSGTAPSDAASAPKTAEPKNAAALRDAAARARDLATLLEELAIGGGGTGAQRKAKAKKALSAVSAAVDEAFE
jgi:hypothetical protein